MEGLKFGKEVDVAVRVVHLACSLCQRVQKGLLHSTGNELVMSKDDNSLVTIADKNFTLRVQKGLLHSTGNELVISKDGNSLVTIADWSVQAIVSWVLSESFGKEMVSIVAEEDTQSLSNADSAGLLKAVVNGVNECLVDAPKYGLQAPKSTLGATEILEAIGQCNSTGGPSGAHWVLDPVDGTLGFVRGDQYAIALALVVDGEVVLGVLGCPNYSMRKRSLLNHDHQGAGGNSSSSLADISENGCVLYAHRGAGQAWMQPLIHEDEKFEWPNFAQRIRVSPIDDPAQATFCEPVEKTNSNQSFTAEVAESMGVKKKPLRVHSMVKYAAIARGDAEIFMKFAQSGYKEKIWDHAAAVVIVEEAGGVVTDAGGRPLNFSRGVYLEGLDRGIIACSGRSLHEKLIGAVYLSWECSNL